jgi:hypothetical protein
MFQYEYISESLRAVRFVNLLQNYLITFSNVLNNNKSETCCSYCKSCDAFEEFHIGYPYSIFLNEEITTENCEVNVAFEDFKECLIEDDNNLKYNLKTWWRNSYFNPENKNYPYRNENNENSNPFFLEPYKNRNKYVFCDKYQSFVPYKDYVEKITRMSYYINPLSVGIIGHSPVIIMKNELELYQKENFYPKFNHPNKNNNFKCYFTSNLKCKNPTDYISREVVVENDYVLTILNLLRVYWKILKDNLPELLCFFFCSFKFHIIIF